MFVCSPSVGQLVRDGSSAGSWRAGLPPSLAAWPRDAVVPSVCVGPGQPRALQWHRGEKCLVGKGITPEGQGWS